MPVFALVVDFAHNVFRFGVISSFRSAFQIANQPQSALHRLLLAGHEFFLFRSIHLLGKCRRQLHRFLSGFFGLSYVLESGVVLGRIFDLTPN